MVAHGTIAFDTLTTSDQVNTGTEKSLDTSYLFNGVAKAYVNFAGNASPLTNRSSFNVSSLTDHGAGQHTVTLTNAFGEECVCGGKSGHYWAWYSATGNTSAIRGTNKDDDGSAVDTSIITIDYFGELA